MARTRQKRPQSMAIVNSEQSDGEISEETETSDEQELDEDMCHLKLNTTIHNTIDFVQINENNNEIKDSLSEKSNDSKNIIYFIESQSEEPLMKSAFQSIPEESNELIKRVIDFNDLKKIKSIDNNFFVINSFNGELFDYLVEKKARIIGPLAVLFCYSTDCKIRFDSIPIKPNPIFSQCMRKLIVSVTGFDELKKIEYNLKIRRMSGQYSKDLTKNVTHLVSDSVRTEKYRVAKSRDISVITSEWVNNCWDKYQYELCRANHPNIINKYRTPIFKNLMITVSQVDVDERNRIMEIVKNNGGVYSPALKLNVANILLLLKEPNGEKFKYAVIKGIPCLDVKWIYDSVEKGYALPEDKYQIIPNSQAFINNTQEIFKMPLNVCNESKQALEKWKKASEIHKSESHKSLGDGLNETIHIEWTDKNIDIRSTSQHINEVNNEKNEDINEPKISSVASSETEVEIIEENVDNIVNIIESSDSNKTEIIESSASRGFMFSGYDEQTKAQFTNIVEKLKGFVAEVLESVTHLIIFEPLATGKLLSAIASGIWILKDDYLFESERIGSFVSEDEFEWGFTLSNSSVSESVKKSTGKKLVISAIEWKKHLSNQNTGNKKLFNKWSVLMVNETKLTIPYAQVLKSGNANVVNLNPDLQLKELYEFKYVFIDQNEVKNLPKYALKLVKDLIKSNKLLRIEFVIHYILNGPNCSTYSTLSRCLVQNSILNQFESQRNRKRSKSKDSIDTNPSKYKK